MTTMTRTSARTVYAEDVVAREYARLSFTKRLILRMVSKDLARASAHLAANPRGYVPVRRVPTKGPFDGLVTNAVNGRMKEAARR